jgi:hypothetical protein
MEKGRIGMEMRVLTDSRSKAPKELGVHLQCDPDGGVVGGVEERNKARDEG